MNSKWILFSLTMALAPVCHSAANIDQLYERIVQKDSKAMTELQKLAKEKDPQAQVLLGFIYEQGVTVPVDIQQAIHWYELACNQEGRYGCYNARYFYQYGKGVTLDTTRAQQYASKSKTDDLNIPAGLMNKIIDKTFTLKAQADTDKSNRAKLIRFVSDYVGQAPESDLIFWERVGFSKSDVLHLATHWAQDGDPQVSYIVGELYLDDFSSLDDKFSQQPKKKALEWFRISAEKGYPAAQYTMGNAYERGGAGLKTDLTQAKKWYEQAAEQKYASALVALGNMHYSGLAAQVDYAKASALFEQAEQGGSTDAALWLSWMNYNGLGKVLDCNKAWGYYEKGAGKYGMKFKKDEYIARCDKDQQAREKSGDALSNLTLKHYGSFIGGENDEPEQCELSFKINADKISNMTSLHLTLVLNDSNGTSEEYTVSVPPFSLNTLGVDMKNNSARDLQDYIDIPMYNRNFCDFHNLTYTVKSATAMLNGKKRDLLKDGNLQLEDK